MAIYSSVPPPGHAAAAAAAVTIDIESWAVSALESLSISPTACGTNTHPTIPLDEAPAKTVTLSIPVPTTVAASSPKPRREALRRDSLRRREALLKGKEGSRRRQRWENDHLLHVPGAQPPLPSDWEVRPTYPVHSVPYYLAPLWDAGVRHRAEEMAAAKQAEVHRRAGHAEQMGRVPAELRQKLKKSKGAKTLLQDLEEEVRAFLREYEGMALKLEMEEREREVDSEDEEIVFVGRNGTMSDEQKKTVEEELEREKLIFDASVEDHGASFGRWLVHSIATYYGLTSRSVTVGPRREAYVGIKQIRTGRTPSAGQVELPRPLWGMI